MVAVIRTIENTVLADHAGKSVRDGDPQANEIVERACAAHGVSVEDWSAALHADADLVRLYDQAIVESVADRPDPGPYDTISRESARGAPDPEPQASERDAKLLNRW